MLGLLNNRHAFPVVYAHMIIPLANNKGEVIIDDDDFELVGAFSWYIVTGGYATAHSHYENGKNKSVRMHRLLLGALPGQQVDHINGNRLDNRRSNLRICTNQQNQMNKRNTKGYNWHKLNKKWIASIRVNYHLIHLGYYATEAEARSSYLRARATYFGEFA